MWYICIEPELWFTIVLIFSIDPLDTLDYCFVIYPQPHFTILKFSCKLSFQWVPCYFVWHFVTFQNIPFSDSFCQQTKTFYSLYDLHR